MVLTNGHCLEGGFIQPGQFVLDKKSNRIFTLLDKGAKAAGRVSAKTILYGTMTKTDMALYQLEKSFSQILNEFNVKPLTLASEYAEIETGIEILSGYWKRGYACEHNGVVHKLKESSWTWEDSIRYSQPGCETIPGTSGSPIIAQGSKTVVGVNNTGNEDGEECTMNNPCEVDAEGKTTFKKGLSYGQQIAWVYDCMGPDHKIDLNLPSCKLPK
jgi:V8-like Glu-specific endopeptidase